MVDSHDKLRVRVVPSAVGDDKERHYATSFLVNDSVAIDAGSIGFYGPPDTQDRVHHVLLTHTHADHMASLPILLENTFRLDTECIEVLGSASVLSCLEQDVFNNRVWPSLDILSAGPRPFVRLTEIEPERPVQLGGLLVTPIEVDHAVDTLGFLVEGAAGSVLFSGDTGPTERIWELARAQKNLRGVFLEASFPNELDGLAEASKHLTPKLFLDEVRKLDRDVPFIAYHVKARFREQIVAELEELELPNLVVGDPREEYGF